MSTRLHLGCGRVRLRDWTNIDAPGPNVYVVGQNEPTDLRAQLETTEHDYYARVGKTPEEIMRDGPEIGLPKLVDIAADLRRLPFAPESVDEILAVEVIEHFGIADRGAVLDHWFTILKPGGSLRLTVPDAEACAQSIDYGIATEGCSKAEAAEARFALRHLLGSRKDSYSFHLSGFTRDGLKRLLGDHGFENITEFENFHCYPSICLRATRPAERLGRHEYQKRLCGDFGIAPKDFVVDVGGGKYPFPRANLVIDIDPEAEKYVAHGQQFVLADARELPLAPKEADFIYCSHMLEHMPDADSLGAVVRELNRVGKRGYVETPSRLGELFAGTFANEPQHRWLVDEAPGGLRFEWIPAELRALVPVEYEAAMARVLRLSATPTRDERTIRQHYWRMHRYMNACLLWDGCFEVMIVT